jgi:adenosine deaminase
MGALVDTFGWGLDGLQWVTVNAMKSAFSHFEQRLRLIEDVIKPGYAELGLR